MDKDNEIDYEKAKRELESSINELRRLRGKKEIPHQDIPEESDPPSVPSVGRERIRCSR